MKAFDSVTLEGTTEHDLAGKQNTEVGTTGVDGAQVLVLDDVESVPAGTPAGTVIVRVSA